MNLALTLPQLGWQAFFIQQLSLAEFEQALIARVTAHHRSGYQLMTQQGPQAIARGELDARRLANYQKLNAEQARNAASLQQRREKERQFREIRSCV